MTTCLIVEESETIRSIAMRLLLSLDVEVREASTAGEAIAIVAEAAPDVVILDWDMSKLGAVEFLKAYAGTGELARPPVVLSATENDPQQMAIARAAGVSEYIFKPYDVDQIADAFDALGVTYGAVVDAPPKKSSKTASPRAAKAKSAG